MKNNDNRRKLAWLEYGLIAGGALLLTAFFLLRGWSEMERQAGVESFKQAHSDGEFREILLAGAAGDGTVSARISRPDVALWSEKRIADYEQSLTVDSELPQALLTIENLNIQVPVYNGADEFNLNRGVARIKGTAAIDETGNLGVAGHRDGFFRGLKDIAVGDSIELQTTRDTVTYQVSSIEIVDPEDVYVLDPTDDRTLTLVTCYPFYFVGHAPKRYIVKAVAEQLLAINQVRES
jgi:sortase A